MKYKNGYNVFVDGIRNKNILIGVNVKSMGKNIEVNAIRTVFAKDFDVNNENVVYKKESPNGIFHREQSPTITTGHNSIIDKDKDLSREIPEKYKKVYMESYKNPQWLDYNNKSSLLWHKRRLSVTKEQMERGNFTNEKTFYADLGAIDALTNKENKVEVSEIDSFGTDYPQYKGTGQKAVDFIAKNKAGQVKGAFHRDDTGDIDVVWGKVTDYEKHKGYGIAHIIDKHGADAVKHIGDVIKNGEKSIDKNNKDTVRFEKNRYRVAVREKWNGKNKKFIMTGFRKKRRCYHNFTP